MYPGKRETIGADHETANQSNPSHIVHASHNPAGGGIALADCKACTTTDPNSESRGAAYSGKSSFAEACWCKSGYYKGTSDASCAACNGTINAERTACTPYESCVAGNYRDTDNACKPCPSYKWSNAGSVGAAACKTIQIKLYYSYWDNGSNKDCPYFVAKWLDAGENLKVQNSLFKDGIETGVKNFQNASRTDGDPYFGKTKGAGEKCRHLWVEGNSIYLDCKTLPCTLLGSGSCTSATDSKCNSDGKQYITYAWGGADIRLKPD